MGREGAGLLFLFVENFRFGHGPVGPVAWTFRVDCGPSHQFLDTPNGLKAFVDRLMVFTAHDDRFFRARVDTKTAVDTAHHIDVEAGRKFLDFRIRVLSRFDIDALGGADRCEHIASDAFKAAVVTHRENMGAAESLGIGSRLFGIVDGGYVPFKKACKEPPKRHRKSAKRRPDGGVLPPRTVADVDRGNVDGVTAAHGRHRNTSSGTGETAAPNDP